jgi:RNA polymerase sigma-70 factor (ECF subfamily)
MELALKPPRQHGVQAEAEADSSPWRFAEVPELQALLRRDARLALEWIHERFAGVVHGLLLARVECSEVEDLTQEVFLRVQANLAELRDPVALPAWIATIARNLAIEHGRRRGREPAREELTEEPPAPPRAPQGEEELRALVLRRLRELPETYRETLALRLIEGLAGPEIAARTGLQPASVRVNLCRGMVRLRALLSKDGVLE